MPRTARDLVDNACYHVLTRGNNRAAVFHAPADYQRYGQLLLTHLVPRGVALYHYCFMTNHVHLVVRAATGSGLRQGMQRLNLHYALAYKRRYPHVGHFWQDRFKSLRIAEERYLLQCGAYVDLNPVRARMVAAADAYPWSSARGYLRGEPDPLVTVSPAYLALGPTPAARQHQYRTLLAAVGPLPSASTASAGAGSSPAHWRELAQLSGLALSRRGRPLERPRPAGSR